jgi:hypothetical protein
MFHQSTKYDLTTNIHNKQLYNKMKLLLKLIDSTRLGDYSCTVSEEPRDSSLNRGSSVMPWISCM